MRQLQSHQKAMKALLERVLKRLDRDSDAGLLSELGSIRNELATVRRGLVRVAISEQSTVKLKNELHDWMHHADVSDGAEHELRQERLEMLASELRLRGIDIPDVESSRAPRPAPRAALETERGARGERRDTPLLDSRLESVVLLDEDEEPTNWEAAGEYWDQLVSGLGVSHHDPIQLARLLKAFRDVQGERKRQDRLSGISRYRLAAFEAWN